MAYTWDTPDNIASLKQSCSNVIFKHILAHMDKNSFNFGFNMLMNTVVLQDFENVKLAIHMMKELTEDDLGIALCFAALCNKEDNMLELIVAKADVNYLNGAPLQIARKKEHQNIINCLIAFHAYDK
jgi:hypothetical protein